MNNFYFNYWVNVLFFFKGGTATSHDIERALRKFVMWRRGLLIDLVRKTHGKPKNLKICNF